MSLQALTQVIECTVCLGLVILPSAEFQMKFTSTYQGKAVTGLVGSSVNFTWNYSAVRLFEWGTKQANRDTLTVKLVSIGQLGTVTFPSSPGSDYDGRVNGIRIGDTSSGQVIFTLSNIRKTDAKLYGCLIYPLTPGQLLVDEVNFRVEAIQIQFTSRYQGRSVTALIGSTVNFTWGFTKGIGGVSGVTWGLGNSGLSDIINNGILVSMDMSGRLLPVPVPAEYNGSVSGSIVGNKFSGQAIFSLATVKKSDGRMFGCKIFPESDFEVSQFDTVNLLVAGG